MKIISRLSIVLSILVICSSSIFADNPQDILSNLNINKINSEDTASATPANIASATSDTSDNSGTEDGFKLVRVEQDDKSQDAETVNTLQRNLQACGYYLGYPIDAWFGPYTQLGVMDFQRDNGLEVSGVVDRQLFDLIAKKAAEKSSETSDNSSGTANPLLEAKYGEYLKSTQSAKSTNSEIVALSKKLRGSSPLETAKNIYSWVLNNLSYSFYYNSQRGALGALSQRSANCCDHANLTVSLMRAAGIPARYQHSTDCRFSSGSHYGHVWCAAYVDGRWVPLDASVKSTSFGNLNFTACAEVRTYSNLSF